MDKPSIVDAFFESCFAVGNAYLRAAKAGQTDSKLFEEHKEYWASTSEGQQQTFQPAGPLSHRFRLLLGDKRTYGRAVCRVRC